MPYGSRKELRGILEQVFEMLSTDPSIGPDLVAAKAPQRFEITDLDIVVNVDAAQSDDEGRYLRLEWSDDIDWKPVVGFKMDSETVNRFFQGELNVPMAVLRGKLKVKGDIKKALALLPIIDPVFVFYADLVEREYPHLKL